jgi:hypothetical protein
VVTTGVVFPGGQMDRIDAMKVFVTAVDEGSLAGAARRLKRSPTAVSRALSFLEARLGVELLHRTTRTLKLSEAGERYAAACRRVLTDLNEADMLASGERSSPRGVLTISAPPVNGEEMLRPIIDEFLDRYSDVSITILLLDRLVNLVDEGVDIAIYGSGICQTPPLLLPVSAEMSGASLWGRPNIWQNTPHQKTGRSGEAPHHRVQQFWSRCLEFCPGERLVHSPNRSVRTEVHRQQCPRRRGVGCIRLRFDPPLFLPRR